MNFASFSQDLIRHRPRRAAGLIAVEQVESTQVLGRRIVEEYVREGSRAPEADIVAWSQTAGRGRHGRTWSSPAGAGVYATLIRWRSERDWVRTLPLQTAVALCGALNAYLAGRCLLKWPNDLLVEGKKIGGILIDAVTHDDESPVAIVSFGVNLGSDAPAPAVAGSTSISSEVGAGEAPELPRLAVELIGAVDRELGRDAPTSRILERYQELSAHKLGEVLRCSLGAGDPLEGRFLGFDEHGFLRLDVDGGERLLSTGEILGSG